MSLISSEGIGLLFKARGDTDDAKKAFNDLEKEIKQTGETAETDGGGGFEGFAQKLGLSEESAAKLGATLPVVGTAIAGIAAAVIGAGAALFSLASQTAEAGAEIDRFSKLTGFSVQTIGALKIAAESAGTSIEEIEEVFESFVELMIEGGQGAEDAVVKIKSLGLDPQTAFKDLEGSFLKVLDKIRDMPSQAGKAKVAMDGMGESGLSMIKVASEMTGGTEAYIQKLKQMGLIMDAEGVRKAAAFSAQLTELTNIVKGATYEFSDGFMPRITQAMKDISGAALENKSVWREWGKFIGDELLAVTRGAKIARAILLDLFLGNTSFSVTNAVGKSIADEEQRIQQQASASLVGRTFDSVNDQDKAKEERQKREQEEIQARARLNAATKESIQQAFDELREITKKNYEEDLITAEKYREDMLENERQYRVRMVELTEQSFAAQLAQAKNQTERKAIETELRTAIEKIGTDSDKRIAEAEKLVVDRKKKLSDDELKNAEAKAQKEIALEKSSTNLRLAELGRDFRNRLITEKEYIEASGELKLKALEAEKAKLQGLTQTEETIQRLKLIEDELAAQSIENAQTMLDYIERQNKALEEQHRLYQDAKTARDADATGSPFGRDAADLSGFLGESVLTTVDDAGNRVHAFAGAWDALKNAAGSALSSMAQGIGSMVQNMILLGNTGGNSFRKLVASVLAGVAAQAAVLAVMELAYGIAALTPWGLAIYGSPALHFKAAALFGGIALGAGLAGRFAAGDEFKNQNSGAFGSAGGAGASSGNIRTPQNDTAQAITMGANSPFRREPVKLHIKLDSDGVLKVLSDNARRNGEFRNLIIDVAEGIS